MRLSAIKRLLAGVVVCGLVSAQLPARADMAVTAGGWTDEACTGQGPNTALTVTASSAYTAGNQVGGLLTLRFARPTSISPSPSGILQSVTLTSASVQTAEFDVSFFVQQPTASTWTDKVTPAIAAGDKIRVRYPVKLTNNFSGLGTHTVYNQDLIGRAVKLSPITSNVIYAVITTPGTPTFTATTDLQLCVAMLQD